MLPSGQIVSKKKEVNMIQEGFQTPEEVDEFIDREICRHDPELRARAESRPWTEEELAAEPKVAAVLRALKRRAELVAKQT